MVRKVSLGVFFSTVVAIVLLAVQVQAVTIPAVPTASVGQTRVLQGIPAIAKAFAPLAGVKWEDFANTLAGICAVESRCDPATTKPLLRNGGPSQYQGIFQLGPHEAAKAENYLAEAHQKMKALAAEGKIPADAYKFVDEAITAGRAAGGDTRLHPEYGVILGAAKHIQIHKQVQIKYPGDPLRQAAAHMTAQFSGITESRIRRGGWDERIAGDPFGDPATSEAAALGANKVPGALTVAGAVEIAGGRYAGDMHPMMVKMSQLTSGMTSVPAQVAAFATPAYVPHRGPTLSVSYGAVSTLMEDGFISPQIAQPIPRSPMMNMLPPMNMSPGTMPGFFSSPPVQNQQQISPAPQQNTTPGNTPLPTPTPIPNQQSTSSTTPSALIIAQSTRIPRRGSTLISWASVGTAPDSCTVTKKWHPIFHGKSGKSAAPVRTHRRDGHAHVCLSVHIIFGHRHPKERRRPGAIIQRFDIRIYT